MKKVILTMLIFFLVIPILHAQNKMNPDGYLGKFALMGEVGIVNARDKFKQFIPGFGPLNKDNSLFGPYLKLELSFPSTELFTLFVNSHVGWYKGENTEFFENISSTRFSLAIGFKLYFK